MPCLAVLLGVGAVVAPAADPVAKPPLDSLVKNSPFGTAVAARPPGSENSQVEFRGMFIDQGEQFFSFHESATNTSQWVGLKETGAPYSVQSYDSATQTVKVLYKNQPFTLTLKRAQVVVQALPPPPAPAQVAAAGPTAGPASAVGAPVSGDEAARLAQVAEEIRRRRALRAQAGQPVQPGVPVPQPNPPPATNPNRR